MQQYLRSSYPFDNRARGDQAYQGINVVFDNHPEAAYVYQPAQDSELYAFIVTQLRNDPDATLTNLVFKHELWRQNYAQKHNLPTDVGALGAGMLGLGALYGPECFFGPDGGGGGGGPRTPLRNGELLERYAETGKGRVGIIADVSIDGATLHLQNVGVYPVGAKHLDVGQREMVQLTRQLAEEARDLGFERLRISGIRYSGANKGKEVDFTIDLK